MWAIEALGMAVENRRHGTDYAAKARRIACDHTDPNPGIDESGISQLNRLKKSIAVHV